jgi:hypothetical protein
MSHPVGRLIYEEENFLVLMGLQIFLGVLIEGFLAAK